MNTSENRSEQSQIHAKSAPPCILVIFGITGDLTKRLLFPALCNLGSENLLNNDFCVMGVSGEAHTELSFRKQLSKNIDSFVTDPAANKYGKELTQRTHYIS